jgi:histone deacetylase complex regulatory component SIN3
MFHGARPRIGLMCCLWIDCSIGVRGIVDRMKVLLRGHPYQKRRFNMCLPSQYELSLRDDDQHKEVPATDSLQGRPAQRH